MTTGYKEITLTLSPEKAADSRGIEEALIRKLGVARTNLGVWRVTRRSIDARRRPVRILLTVRVAPDAESLLDREEIEPLQHVGPESPSVIIVGAGPAGLFGALKALQSGVRPIVLERGADVESRRRDLTEISRSKKINPVSNYCFGEGGAGAYSDGKLFTRSKKRGNVNSILHLLVHYGASEDILIDAHPHIGSDKLPKIIKNIREDIIAHGGEVRFHTKAEKLIIEDNKVIGVETQTGQKLYGPVVLANGHSAHDFFRTLAAQGVEMEPKGIAMGVRLEHPQKYIDQLQYHSQEGRGEYLPAAEYSFVTQVDDRGVYSFCMCPGGVIVPAGSFDGELVVNGMSASARGGKKANSGMVVEIRPGDFKEYSWAGPLEILEIQSDLERKFFETSKESIVAPGQRMRDFVEGKVSDTLPDTSYAPGLYSADFNKLLPPFIAERLRKGFMQFDSRRKGFLTNDATLIGLESRTSSPVRLPRDKETLEHTGLKNLYPAGEGAGYAGGIVSAAIDGQRCVESACKTLKQQI